MVFGAYCSPIVPREVGWTLIVRQILWAYVQISISLPVHLAGGGIWGRNGDRVVLRKNSVLCPIAIPGEPRQLRSGAPNPARAAKFSSPTACARSQSSGLWVHIYQGKTYDAGDKLGFLIATVEIALKNLQFGADFRSYLRGLKL